MQRAESYGVTAHWRPRHDGQRPRLPRTLSRDAGLLHKGELARFLQIALSSATELEYHLLLSHDLTYLEQGRYERLRSQVQEVKRMLTGFLRTVRTREAKRQRDIRGQKVPLTSDP